MPGGGKQSSEPTSMLQGLQAILGALGSMMAAPDSDIQFLTGLQHVIVDKIKKGTQQAVGGQPPNPASQVAPGGGGGMSGFGAGAGAPGGPMQPPGAQPPGGAPPPGMAAPGPGGLGAPNPDELRRVLGANAQAA
jgi:hypothetical protein